MNNTELEAVRADRNRAAQKRSAALAVRQTETPNALETYDQCLERVRYDAETLLASIAELREAAAATGRTVPPGYNVALTLENVVTQQMRAWQWLLSPRPDPVAARVKEAEESLDRQRRFLDWAKSLPRTHEGKDAGVRLYTENVKAAERQLRRAKGEPDPADAVTLSERLDALVSRIGVRAAREQMGLPVDALPEVPPMPRG